MGGIRNSPILFLKPIAPAIAANNRIWDEAIERRLKQIAPPRAIETNDLGSSPSPDRNNSTIFMKTTPQRFVSWSIS
jgi:hypothetical protein